MPSSPALSRTSGITFQVMPPAGSGSSCDVTVDITAAPYNCPTNGTSDCRPAWMAFKAAYQNYPCTVTVTMPTATYKFMVAGTQADNYLTAGIPKLVVEGNNSTFNDNGTGGLTFGAQNLMAQNSAGAALFNSVSAGSGSITLVSAGDASKFTVGRWVALGAIDLQGSNAYPPNPGIWEFAYVTNISGSTITFNSALQNSYLSTYPVYSPGGSIDTNEGGPATIYAMGADWDCMQTIKNLNFDISYQFSAGGRTIIWDNISTTAAAHTNAGPFPSQNYQWTLQNSTMSVIMEVDKYIDAMTIYNCTLDQMSFQSSGARNCYLTNSTITRVNGTASNMIISGCTIAQMDAGSTGFGGTNSITATNSSIPILTQAGARSDNLETTTTWSLSSGVLSNIPTSQLAITGAASSGAPFFFVRIQVASTAGYPGGNFTARIWGVTGTTEANGSHSCSVFDGTHIDLRDTTFVNAYTGGGTIGLINTIPWIVKPNGWAFFGKESAGNVSEGAPFQVTALSQGTTNVDVTTSLTTFSSMPNLPYDATAGLSIFAHPCLAATFTNCTGADGADQSQAAAQGKPLFSYSKRTYTCNTASSNLPMFQIFGEWVSATIDVTQAYTGAAGTLTLLPFGRQFNSGSNLTVVGSSLTSNYNPSIVLNKAGTRVITPTGVTGATSSPTSSDSITAPGAGVWLTNPPGEQATGPYYAPDVSGESSAVRPEFTIEIITSHGF